MADYYVSTARGSDSTGAGTATNPWKTIGKAIGASPAITTSGVATDRLFIEPGTYYEAVVLGVTPTTTSRLEIIGDCDGAGFFAGGYTTPATGIVDWSAWANETTPINKPCLDGGAKSFVTLRRLKMHGGDIINSSCVAVTTGQSWTLVDSIFVPKDHVAIGFGTTVAPATAGLNLTIERCDVHLAGNNGGRSIRIVAAEAAAEYSLQSRIRNCRFWGAMSILLDTAPTGLGALATGLTIEHCSFMLSASVSGAVTIYTGVPIVLAVPIQVRGCIFLGWTGITAGHLSHVTEDWNVFNCWTPRTNVAVGTNSAVNARPAVDREDGRLVGTPLRPIGQPMPGSRFAGFVGVNLLPDDLDGRPRPAGLGSRNGSAGAVERHDSAIRDTLYADAGSGGCLKLAGPGDHERPVLVQAAPTTISVKVRWDGNHGDAAKPRVVMLAEPEIGVAGQVATATSTGGVGATPNTYETLTFFPITPVRAGVIVLRFESRPSAATGTAYFDTISAVQSV